MAAPNKFLLRNKEKAEHNQYWYSASTIATFVEEVQEFGTNTVRYALSLTLYPSGADFKQMLISHEPYYLYLHHLVPRHS
jgi:hypothetical protein